MARRSVLFSPGDRPELLEKAPETGADVIVFDLEDGVAPARKAEARAAVADVLSGEFDPDCEVCVRVSATETSADLDALVGPNQRLDALVLPKVGAAEEVMEFAAQINERGREIPVFALIETAVGVLHAEPIAAAESTTAVCLGAEDLAADIGAHRSSEGVEMLYAREHVVLAAAAAGIDAIDTLVTDFEDDGKLQTDAGLAADLGFDGKLAIHPAQIAPINAAFTPDPERVAWAERVVAAAAEANVEGRGVTRVEGEMIDAPLVARAETILERASATNTETTEE